MRELLVLALILSILVHLFGGALFPWFSRAISIVMHRPEPQLRQDVATSDVIRLEKRAVPRPAERRPPPQQPQPQQRAVEPRVPSFPRPEALERQTQPAPSRAKSQPSAKPEVAHITVHAPKQLAKSKGEGAPEAARAAHPSHKAALSSEQIAQLESKFAKTIADSRTDIATITQQTREQPAAPKHYSMPFNGIHGDLRRGEGYIWPIAPARRVGGYVYYYTHYEYMYADGHVESDDIPWEFVYPIRGDLFAYHVREIPMQLPPPGFRPNRPLQPLLAQYFGGPPPPP